MNNQMPDKVNIRDSNGNITTISYSELQNHEEMIIKDNIFHAAKTGEYTDEEIKDYEKQAKAEWKNLKQHCTSGSVRGCKAKPLTQTKYWVKVRCMSRKSTRQLK